MEPSSDNPVTVENVPSPAVAAQKKATRAIAAFLLIVCAGVLALAVWLRPDPRGYGTHEQLHLGRFLAGPCGFMLVTHYPCPTCGMTTAFAHTVRGQWWRAFMAQPAGFVLALLTIVILLLSAWVLITGRWPMWLATTFTPFRFFLGLLVCLLGGWAFKLFIGLAMGTLPVPS